MSSNNFFQFKNLKKQKNLIHGIFGMDFGNIDLKYGGGKEVLDNKKKIADRLNIDWKQIFSIKQVHGSNIKILIKKLRDKKINIIDEADGIVSNKKNTFLMVKTADCFPIIFFDPFKKVAAVIHVGWRGAVEKIFLIALLKMSSVFGSKIKNILVGIGPGISHCCFKHKRLIQEQLPEWSKYIKQEKKGQKSVDMLMFIKDQLIETGVERKNIESSRICTSCSKDYFSHLRSLKNKEKEGRFATIIGIK